MSTTRADSDFMARAQALAYRGLYTTNPNPMVGCVIVGDGRVIAEGWHRKAGEAHAEVDALARAEAAGESVKGATVYVSLEPCGFQGKTGPCSQALIDAGVGRVVYGMADPNPRVSGRGLEALEAAGVTVDGPLLEQASQRINPGFIKRMETGLPWVRVKMAMSLDGRTAMANGESKWVTSPAARRDVQRLRARSSAVISGIDSVLRDKARLSVRAAELGLDNAEVIAERQPLRVILDSRGRLNAEAPLLNEPGEILWVNAKGGGGNAEGVAEQSRSGVRQVCLDDGRGRIDLAALLAHLGEAECNEVLVEAGPTLAGQFVQQGLVDELVIYMAPKLMGSDAQPLFELPLQTMASQLPLHIHDIRAVGADWRITASPDRDG